MKQISVKLYKLIYMSLICLLVLFIFNEKLGINEVLAGHVILMFAVIVYVLVFENSSKMIRALMVGGVMALFIAAITLSGKERLAGFIVENNFVFHIVALVILSFVIVKLWIKLPVFKIVTAISGAAILCYLVYNQSVISRVGVASLVTFLLMLLVDIIRRDNPAFISSLLPVWAIFFILLFFTKESAKPYDWKYVKEAYVAVRQEAMNLLDKLTSESSDDFFLSMDGYGGSSKIGDKAASGDTELMIIRSDGPMPCNLYLAGEYKGQFDGREWKESKAGGANLGIRQGIDDDRLRKIDTLETLYAIDRYDKNVLSDMIVKNHVTTEYRNFSTSKNFMGSKSIVVNNDAMRKKLHSKKGLGDEIKSMCVQIYATEEPLHELIMAKENGKITDSEYEWNSVCRKYLADDVSFDDYIEYRNNVASAYCGEVDISTEAAQWIDEVTKGAKTTDERLFAIQRALRDFTYTKDVDPHLQDIESPEEFLDYFLIEKKEGYCTYFATAFVLLARAEGMPARYVQGFYVPMKGRRENFVRPKMAHAWAEVYFEGIGWIPFENTPSYEGIAYEKVDYALIAENAKLHAMEQALEDDPYEELELERIKNEENSRELRRLLLLTIVIIVVMLIIGIMVNIILRRVKYSKLTNYEKYIYNVKQNLNIISKLGLSPEKGETLSEFNLRVADHFAAKCEEASDGEWKPIGFIFEYENVIYGGKKVSEEMILKVCDERSKMVKYLSLVDKVIAKLC